MLAEKRTLGRIFDIGFQVNQAALPGRGKQFVQQFECLKVMVPVEFVGLQQLQQALEHADDSAHRVRDQHSTGRGASDNHQLGRLQQNEQFAMLEQVPSYKRAEDNNNSDNRK